MEGRQAVLLNVGLRGAMLISKFFFIFIAARYLTLEDLGTFSLLVATIAYSLFLLGLEFYTFATREVIGLSPAQQGKLIADQFRLYLFAYVIFFLPLMAVFWAGLLEWRWVGFFYSLLLCEHVSQEITRLMVALGRPLVASLLLFIRTASWAVVALLLFILMPASQDLVWVLGLWLIASAASVVLGLYWLRFVPWLSLFKGPLPTSWWWRGLKIALPFLVSTLAIRAVFTLDRYAIEFWDGVAMVGVYAVYIGLCSAMLSFMEAAVFQFTYPKLVGLVKSGDVLGFRSAMLRFSGQVVCLVLLSVIGLASLTEWVLNWLGKEAYLSHLPLFWWLLGAHVLLVISYIPHYALYAMKQDRWIFYGHVGPLLVFLLCLSLSHADFGMPRVVLALNAAFAVALLIKVIGFIKPYRRFMKLEGGGAYAQQ